MSDAGQGYRIGRTFRFGIPSEGYDVVLKVDLVPTERETFGVGTDLTGLI
jgi:hypothetical protein